MKTYIKTQFNEHNLKPGDEILVCCVDRDDSVGVGPSRIIKEVKSYGLWTEPFGKLPSSYFVASKFDFFKLHDGEFEFGRHGPTEDIIFIDDSHDADADGDPDGCMHTPGGHGLNVESCARCSIESMSSRMRVGDVEVVGDSDSDTPPNIVWRYSDASHEGPPETVFINDIPYDKRPKDNTEPVKGCDDSEAPYDWSQHLTGTKLEADWNSDTDDDIIALKATLRYAEVLLNRIARRG